MEKELLDLKQKINAEINRINKNHNTSDDEESYDAGKTDGLDFAIELINEKLLKY